ncbi:His-Xaa-Ser repeat protein HxsA2 [Burkholderia sp. BDU5]|uniref:His-Xaa-Ser repeat protein HxsA2 n=1 Tax=Burkholderia sp. BDU5 TaxID=1385590 RepID=UPI0009EC0C24|nr:His-Xaa-Ser repeat protein HxsA2 [Burkholderia sp. BDU5]
MKAKFLVPLTTIIAAIAAEHSSAAVLPPTNQIQEREALPVPGAAGDQSGKLTVRAGEDSFSFVLKRSTQTGLLMAQHESHESHSSHSSHSSHYSHRSGDY